MLFLLVLGLSVIDHDLNEYAKTQRNPILGALYPLPCTIPRHHLHTSASDMQTNLILHFDIPSPALICSWLDADGVPYMHRCGVFQLRHFMGMVPPRMLFAAEHLGGGPGQYGQGGWHMAAGIVEDKEDEILEFWCVSSFIFWC